MNKSILLLLAAACALPFTARAQRDNRTESGVVTVVNNDTVDASRVEKHLKANAPQAPNDNGLPRFAIVGKDHKFYLGIGAQFLGEAVMDFGAKVPSATLFAPSSFTPAPEGSGASLGFGWQTSSIDLNFLALPGTKDQVGVFFKANFMGSGNAFNCYHFYAKYRGLTVGYTTGLFTDGAAEPMTIDFEGPNGYPYMTMFNASWTQTFGEHFSAAAGIEAPTTGITTGSTTASVTQRIPAVPFYVQYAWAGGNSHVRLSGLVRPMQYRNLADKHNATLTGLGAQISGMTSIYGPLSLNFNAAYGRGIATYLQDDNGLGLDAVALTTPGKAEMTRSLGLTAGLNCAITPKLSANLVYSHLTNYLPSGAADCGSMYRYGDYVVANLIYNINSYVAAGLEYDYGFRRTFDGSPLHANRLQLQLSVTL